ncbi:NADPH-dependent ferric siderophore reductase, contains FAD-binding and SIP domains [Streptomyces sp. 2224.1]|uniref:siderophore-interacting protein n=1 Tax=unclassified Streptomyces TaxID=2593676 RepID=UPI00087FFC51|nr:MULTISPECIES: siderophore-interacting protein [unclassified Streptomyces]PBC81445.1 NADPH-dependent ferric siderophore reductase [Streptomyces sp. 2321.6]SDR54999.1 NADPH-dependent ferric siderophore reductase, contains FAD-binding and SIP domains [Streptomyces sp. KS_16]SEC15533.1 NADPH-dependent ferric siderophore reductase, contains FAD-binding and SIP domains [Streptomyces sp. 2133.1]SED15772.1 NADPH-dependent ferric siderophore reductase, contains FAD-binding and SIP domains [Streptomyc
MAAERPSRKKPTLHRARVERTEQLTPHMVRVVLGGDGLAEFTSGEYSDHYVKLVFPLPGVSYPEPFDIAQIRADFPRDQWPSTRTYTVRAWDAGTRELTVDFVVHGDEGLAGPWAAAAKPGEEIFLLGPGGAYVPEASADWHLLAGDESALPAIAASLARMPAGAPVHAFIEVAGPEERQELEVPPGAEVTWLYRGAAPVGRELVAAVRALEFPAGRVQAFVHGEAGFVKELRHLLRVEHAVPREALSVSGYWRTGHNEDGWQAAKRDWNQQVEAEQESAPATAS